MNVHLPDELAHAARAEGLDVSEIAQDALRESLAHRETNDWLDWLEHNLPCTDVPHERVIAAIDEARTGFLDNPA